MISHVCICRKLLHLFSPLQSCFTNRSAGSAWSHSYPYHHAQNNVLRSPEFGERNAKNTHSCPNVEYPQIPQKKGHCLENKTKTDLQVHVWENERVNFYCLINVHKSICRQHWRRMSNKHVEVLGYKPLIIQQVHSSTFHTSLELRSDILWRHQFSNDVWENKHEIITNRQGYRLSRFLEFYNICWDKMSIPVKKQHHLQFCISIPEILPQKHCIKVHRDPKPKDNASAVGHWRVNNTWILPHLKVVGFCGRIRHLEDLEFLRMRTT